MKTGASSYRKEAQRALALLSRSSNASLELDENALAQLDKMVRSDDVRLAREDRMAAYIYSFGCLLGEVMCARYGGKWMPASKPLDGRVRIRLNARANYDVDVFRMIVMRMEGRTSPLPDRLPELEKALGETRKTLMKSFDPARR
jgi:hypothetical protein